MEGRTTGHSLHQTRVSNVYFILIHSQFCTQDGLKADASEHEKADEEMAGAEDAVKQVG